MLNIDFGQDGDIIRNELSTYNLLPSDMKYSKLKRKFVFDFVGFIIKDNNMLAVFPKHFFDEESELMLNPSQKEKEENINLLFKVISKYVSENKNVLLSDKYIGYKDNFESDYPFESFFKVYDYYRKYGIYREEENFIAPDCKGRISWKDTIQKANVVVSNKNLIFMPLYSKKKTSKEAFISQCMVYIINHTLRLFPYFIELQPITNRNSKIDFLANKEYTLSQLYQYKNSVFKDIHKELINTLIKFFEQYNEKANGGAIHFKINYFDMIWEKMVNTYLNDCFVKVDKSSRKLIFEKRDKIRKEFNSRTFDIDSSRHNFKIRPDHYLEEDGNMYVFDSKYYTDITDLNYKQVSYTILLGNSQLGDKKNLYSALLLPGKRENGWHLKLNLPYCQLNQGCNYIIEHFLDVKLLMKNYLNLNIEDESKETLDSVYEEYTYQEDDDYSDSYLKVAEDDEEYTHK